LQDAWQITFHLIIAWASELAVWFFGLYSFAEQEVSEAVERLKELRKMMEEEKLKGEKVELAIEARAPLNGSSSTQIIQRRV
jgi:hypothetical protein